MRYYGLGILVIASIAKVTYGTIVQTRSLLSRITCFLKCFRLINSYGHLLLIAVWECFIAIFEAIVVSSICPSTTLRSQCLIDQCFKPF